MNMSLDSQNNLLQFLNILFIFILNIFNNIGMFPFWLRFTFNILSHLDFFLLHF